MLEIQDHWNKECNKFAFEGDKLNNMQPIHQKLLELAVRHTVHYSTDILILIEHLDLYFVRENDEVDIYFRNTGIDWYTKAKTAFKPKQYRYIAKLKREGNDLFLYHTLGNC